MMRIECVIVNGGRLSGYIVKGFWLQPGLYVQEVIQTYSGGQWKIRLPLKVTFCIASLPRPGRDSVMLISVLVTLKFFILQLLPRKSGCMRGLYGPYATRWLF